MVRRRGEMAFWLGTLIHRGRRPAHCTERLTLMGGLQRHSDRSSQHVEPMHASQAPWRLDPAVREALPPAVRPWWDNWRAVCDFTAEEAESVYSIATPKL